MSYNDSNEGKNDEKEVPMNKKLTMRDIAEYAGVTKSTVSRYFNGGYVKEDTRKKIKKVIDKYHYEPNTFAQSLKAKESKIIGVIAPCLDSTVSGRMLMAIDQYLRKDNYTSLFVNTSHDIRLELRSIESLWRMKADGIILLATEITEEHAQIAEKLDIPLLFVAQKYEHGISVIYDDFEAGKFVGEYIGQRHFERPVYVGVTAHDEAIGVHRRNGVFAGLAKYRIKNVKEIIADFSYEGTKDKIAEYLRKHRVDVMICATDTQAMAAYQVIKQRGLKIPEDISVIGFGGYEASEILTPKLSAVRYDSDTAGYLAGETMIKMINQEPVSKTQVVDYTFIEGESVKECE